MVGLVSRNSMAVGHRAVACAIYNMTYQIGSIAAVNIYRAGDSPFCEYCVVPVLSPDNEQELTLYDLDYTANKGLVGLCCGNICLFGAAKLYYVWRNRRLDKELAGLPESEKSRMAGLRFAH